MARSARGASTSSSSWRGPTDRSPVSHRPRRLFLASDPDLIQQVLITDAKHYIKHFGARTFKPVLGNGLVTSEGEFWLRQRRLIQPAFLKARVLSYVPEMIELTKAMLMHWSPGKSVNIDSEFSALTSAIALKTLFGLEAQGDRERLDVSLRLAFDLLTTRLDGPFQVPIWLPTPANLRCDGRSSSSTAAWTGLSPPVVRGTPRATISCRP